MNTAGSVLLDTNVVVAHLRNDPDLTARLRATPAIYGLGWSWASSTTARSAPSGGKHNWLLPDRSTIERYAQVKAELAGMGRLIPDNDIWIAAMARQFDLSLVTRDGHFAAVPALSTLAW